MHSFVRNRSCLQMQTRSVSYVKFINWIERTEFEIVLMHNENRGFIIQLSRFDRIQVRNWKFDAHQLIHKHKNSVFYLHSRSRTRAILYTFFIVVVVVVVAFVILKHYCVHCAIISFPYLNKTIWFIFTVLCMIMGLVDVMISLCFFLFRSEKKRRVVCQAHVPSTYIQHEHVGFFFTHLIWYSIARWIVRVYLFDIFFSRLCNIVSWRMLEPFGYILQKRCMKSFNICMKHYHSMYVSIASN